jgi:hypothetical protein
MTIYVLISAVGREVDRLRQAASRIAGQSQTEWWTDKAPTGTVFFFDSDQARNSFCSYCNEMGVRFTVTAR